MLDGMLIIPSTLSYYQSLYSYIKSLNPSYTVMANPGQPYLNGVSAQDYLSTADVFNLFEGPNSAPPATRDITLSLGQTWFESYPSDRFWNTIYDVAANSGDPSQSSAMLADLSEAVQLDTGYVYITDLSGGNPYDGLPSYWDQEVSAVAATPEPGTLALLVSGVNDRTARKEDGRAEKGTDRKGDVTHQSVSAHGPKWVAAVARPSAGCVHSAIRPGAVPDRTHPTPEGVTDFGS